MNRSLVFTLALIGIFCATFSWPTVPATAAEAIIGYRDFRFGASCNSTPTGEKPKSKLWWNDGFWWGSLCSSTDSTYHIFRLDLATQIWVDTGIQIDDRPASKADTLWDGQKLYIASHMFSVSGAPIASPSQWGRLYRYSYHQDTRRYSLDSGFPVDVTRGKSETLVIEKAVNNQLWVTYVENGNVMVNYSIGGDNVWATPMVLPASGSTKLSKDDISAMITFNRSTATPQIGIMWSNQKEKKVYFAAHTDGAPTTVWNSFGVAMPSSGSPAPADDHINIKLQSDGQGIYAVTKTSNSRASEPLIVLLSCRLACSAASSWNVTPVYSRNENHTRAILLLDTTHRKIHIFSTTPESGGSIYRVVFDMDRLSPTSVPESKTVFIKHSLDTNLNNPTSTKQTVNAATGLVVLASDQNTRFYLHNYDPLLTPHQVPVPVLEKQVFVPLIRLLIVLVRPAGVELFRPR
jgi:hypothetical protein